MEIALAVIYFVGLLIAMIVLRSRAGLGQGRLKIFGDGGVGLEWALCHGTAVMFWPIALVIWLARGRPEPRIVFNHKVAERRHRSASA